MTDPTSRRKIVAQACITDSPYTQRVLLLRRSMSNTYPGMWETPGGEVEAGETVPKAVERETLEESGLVVLALHPFHLYEYDEPEGPVVCVHFRVGLLGPMEVKLSSEHDSFALVAPEDLHRYSMFPNMKEAVERAFAR